MQLDKHKLVNARWLASSYFDERSKEDDISLLVIHNISLPPGQFGTKHIDQLFTGQLNPKEHPYFEEIYQLQVSSHCLVQRDGSVTQYVPFNKRAWHAGVSTFQGRSKCNDYSIGIELEGTDDMPYTPQQYQSLCKLSQLLMSHYPAITRSRIVGHNDIAPGRKSDPGVAFDWAKYRMSVV